MGIFTYLKIGGVMLVAGICFVAYMYIKGLQDDVVELTAANAKYEFAIKEVNNSLKEMKAQQDADKERIQQLDTDMKASREKAKAFEVRLAKHDLAKIIQRKPKWFEKIAQKGTDNYYDELKELSEWRKENDSNN